MLDPLGWSSKFSSEIKQRNGQTVSAEPRIASESFRRYSYSYSYSYSFSFSFSFVKPWHRVRVPAKRLSTSTIRKHCENSKWRCTYTALHLRTFAALCRRPMVPTNSCSLARPACCQIRRLSNRECAWVRRAIPISLPTAWPNLDLRL